ncbi:hypothetical protein V6N12_042479 [Hibiscus sabdariffa]|uniref:Uncharacterized protein n=1 Tax=Hibiscus sabdariffa TaxID=183260 RepID=A0ABR2EGG1_9ROSI
MWEKLEKLYGKGEKKYGVPSCANLLQSSNVDGVLALNEPKRPVPVPSVPILPYVFPSLKIAVAKPTTDTRGEYQYPRVSTDNRSRVLAQYALNMQRLVYFAGEYRYPKLEYRYPLHQKGCNG